MTQNEAILKHLKRRGTITRIDAFMRHGVCNLWARIAELRDDGHRISGYRCRVRTRYGAATVMRYYLVGR